MQEEDYKEFIKKAKEFYYGIGSRICPAFQHETIYFNRHGWNHIMRKQGRPRSKEERIRRINLLKHLPRIVSTSNHIHSYKQNIVEGHPAHFWILRHVVVGIWMRVVIRQLNGGLKHYFSVMDETKKSPLDEDFF